MDIRAGVLSFIVMVKLDRIYTRGGDGGETSLGDGSRVKKTDPLVAAFGTADEANAAIGIARLHADPDIDAVLARVQNDLFDVGGDLCVPLAATRRALRVTQAQVDWLEGRIDAFNEALEPLNSFVLPGGTPAAAYLHLARTITRRAERETLAALGEAAGPSINPIVVRYLNRLSDLLFVLSRHANDSGRADVKWIPGANRGES
jgi:cob(I)alamin adenosyltransferase